MKNIIFLTSIVLILSFSSSYSQWLEKEGYWELSEKIPDLRDLKIIPEENLVITVSKDNTIRHIEYDSGKILKSGKPEGLTDSNDYAKISSDGKTTVVARYVKNEKSQNFKNVVTSIIKNEDISILNILTIDPTEIYPEYLWQTIYSLKFAEGEYFFLLGKLHFNLFVSFRNIQDSWLYEDSRNEFYTGIFENNQFINLNKNIVNLDKNHFRQIPNIQNFKFPKIILNYSMNEYLNGNKAGGNSQSISVYLFNSNMDSLAEVLSYDYSYSWVHDSDPTSSGYQFKLQQILKSDSENNLYLRAQDKLFKFDLKSCELTDSVENRIFQGNVQISNKNQYIHSIHRRDYNSEYLYQINLLPGMRYIYTFPIALNINPNFALPVIDEKNQQVLFSLADGKLFLLKPEVMFDISQSGFIWSKDTAEVGEDIEFTALINKENCEFTWEFEDGEIQTTTENSIKYTFKNSGLKSVKLTVKTPEGENHLYEKKDIVTVWEVLKADFDTEILNNEIPVKVKFTDKSKGTIISWKWDFGDGETSTEQNPEHEYKYPGDFSPRLIISNNLNKDTIIIYEGIQVEIGKVDADKSTLSNIENTGLKSLNLAYLINDGFIIDYRFNEIENIDVGYYHHQLFFRLSKLNFQFQKLNNIDIAYLHYSSSSATVPKDYSIIGFFEGKESFYYFSESYVFSRDYIGKIDISILDLTKGPNTELKQIMFNKGYHFDESNIVFVLFPGNDIINTNTKSGDIINENWSLPLYRKDISSFYSDTVNRTLLLLQRYKNSTCTLFSISLENTINYEKSFSLDTSITLSNIKSVNDNLVLLYGSVEDKLNNTTYAYFGKYHPLENLVEDTILYSRKDIRKIERINDKWYAAIGQSRGRQGYLILDTNLQQVKDIRVDSLTGEIKDMLLHDNKVYLFTEKIIIEATNSLGPNERYQTTGSVLELPEDIIASVENIPVITGNSFTHSVYPNPANDMFQLKIGSNVRGNYTVKLYDLFGREVMDIFDGMIEGGTEKIFELNTSRFGSGIYYYVISNSKEKVSEKIMIIR